MEPEKRKYTRNDIFLIIHFRLIHNSGAYDLGTSRNYSDNGVSLESHSFDYKPGQILECTLSHPGGNRSVSIAGEIVWKKDCWYDAVMGIKFFHMDESNFKAIRELAAAKRKESIPVLSEDTALNTENENHIQSMSTHSVPSEDTDILPPPFRAMPSTKRRQSYLRFFVFLVLSTAIIFSVAARDGKDVLPWFNFSDLKADISLPGPINMNAAVASDNTSAAAENDRKLISSEKTQSEALSHEAELPNDIIRDEIMFDANSTSISSKFYSIIDKTADILLGNPGLIVKLEGHTDSAGSAIYNMDLSIRRAAAVRSKLMNKGIISSRIKIICFGNSSPVASNDAASGRMKNRRVEISIPSSHS
jgi:outer membrane protein OmpA-like peptidoglycan-associated protein